MVSTDRAADDTTQRLTVARPAPVAGRRFVPRAPRAAARPAAAVDDGSASPTASIRHVMKVFAIGAALALVFTAPGLVHSAHGMDDGPKRSVSLAVGQVILAVTSAVHLTAPFDVAEQALGRGQVLDNGQSPLTTASKRSATTPATPPSSTRPAAAHSHKPALHYPMPTPHHPLRLIVTGDSLTEYLAPQLVAMATQLGPVVGFADTHYGTGLDRPDYVDWSVLAKQQVAQDHPGAIVVFMGGNDFQNIQLPNGKILYASTPAWTREYERRAAVCMRIWTQHGHARVYWLSMPPARSDAWSYNNAQIDKALRGAAQQVAGAEYLNILGPITDHGKYSDYVNYHGQYTLVRTPDGIHLTETGSSIVASEVLAVLKHDWHLGRHRAQHHSKAVHRHRS